MGVVGKGGGWGVHWWPSWGSAVVVVARLGSSRPINSKIFLKKLGGTHPAQFSFFFIIIATTLTMANPEKLNIFPT